MKKLTALILVMVLAGFCLPAVAQEIDKTVILFRSMDDPNIPPDPAVCDAGNSGFEANLSLGASLWSFQTKSNNGTIVKEKVQQIGTATSCVLITDLTFPPFGTEAPNYVEFTIGDLFIAVSGECEATVNPLPEGPLFVSCYLEVIPERSTEGIKWGQAISNSTFTPIPIPGFETGSFWSIQLIWE